MTKGEDAISNKRKSLDSVAPCCREEADTRIFVHARDATLEGSKSLIIKDNDTDIVVIARRGIRGGGAPRAHPPPVQSHNDKGGGGGDFFQYIFQYRLLIPDSV